MSSLEEIDAVLSRADAVDEATPPATLRRWRTELVRASVFVSYAIGVLSLDMEILTRSAAEAGEGDVLQATVDDLPDLLAAGWVGGGWSLSPDAAVSVAAAEVAVDEAEGLLALHADVVLSDLGDPDVVRDLLPLVEHQRRELLERREQLERRIRKIQKVVVAQYTTGDASVDDWLN